ncbi:MAG: sulfatase-like hydrolase/transferase, partial [Tannerellaceae bacterium]
MVPTLASADSYYIKSYLRNVMPWSLLFIQYAVFLTRMRNSEKKIMQVLGSRRFLLIFALILTFSCGYYITTHFGSFAVKERGYIFEEEYRVPPIESIKFPSNKNNLIVIFLESVENTFNDPRYFDEPLMPNLDKIQKANTAFYGRRQVYGTGWTIAGITASLFGMPLIIPFEDNSYANFADNFLPKATGILEVLEHHGYNISFFQGTGVEFGGLKMLIDSHSSHCNINDYIHYAKQGYNVEEHRSVWGFSDEFMYARVKEELSNYNSDSPFCIFISTIDTHSPEGHFTPCVARKYNDFRDVWRSSDYLTSGFLNWLKYQKFYKRTTIVLIGDHLMMRSDFTDRYLEKNCKGREALTAIINSRISTEQSQRHFATFDIAPTILESVGANIPENKFGLGVSLLSNKETLLESIGEEKLNVELAKSSRLYNTFFGKQWWLSN